MNGTHYMWLVISGLLTQQLDNQNHLSPKTYCLRP